MPYRIVGNNDTTRPVDGVVLIRIHQHGIGETHFKLTQDGPRFRAGLGHWLAVYRCECGNYVVYPTGEVNRNDYKACGCSRQKQTPALYGGTSHKKHKTLEYNSWSSMIQRCLNPKNIKYKNYGGRGIKVCERWLLFVNFYSDMGPKPPKCTIDRIDVNGNYCLENCRWATNAVQASNKTTTRYLVIDGERKSVVEWAALVNIPAHRIRGRLSHGAEHREAVFGRTQ